jgi:DNA-binding SARP family transcriptional activator/TolB-like protein
MIARVTGNSSAGKMESERPAQLTVSLFGGVSLNYKGRRVDVTNHKGLALIGYLALTPGLRETRERIVGFFWSETEETKARATLRQTLKELRTVFEQCGYGGFFTDRAEIGFEESSITLDVWLVLERLAAGRPHDLLLDRSRITETLLLGYEDADPSFRVWLLVSRENLRRKLIRGLEDQIAANTSGGEGLRRLAEALIQLDPTHEGAYQTLMRCHADSGDLSGALSAYKQLWDLLDSEYDMEPSEKSQELVSAIKLASYTSGRGTEETPVAERPLPPAVSSDPGPVARIEPAAKLVLVIAAFDHGGLHADKQYIALGFRYELIWRLVRFREWALVDASPETSGVSPPLPHYRLNANLFQEHDAVHVILTLHSGQTGTVIWSDRYSLALTDFFATQQHILHGLATSLNVHVSAERLARTSSAPDVSLDVYDRWLRAQSLISLYQPINHERAAQILESIITEADHFAPAYSSLVQLENTWHIVYPGVYRTVARHHRALSLAQTAVRLDALDSRAHLCLAWAQAMNQRFEMAVAGFRHARSLNEYDPWTTTSAALGLAYAGELDEARDFADRALYLAPIASPLHWCYQSTVRLLCGDYDASVRAAERAGDAINYFGGWRAAALAHAGRPLEAAAEGERFLAVIRRVWAGATEPSDETITRWLLHCFPFRDPNGQDVLRAGLEAAGLPAPRA